jgi:hypothetical protein
LLRPAPGGMFTTNRQDRAHTRPPVRLLNLQVFQRNKREGRPHGDTESEPRDQSRDALAVHLLSPLIRGPGLRV